MPKILLIEDDCALAESLAAWFRRNLYTVEVAPDCATGRDFVSTYQFDALMIDWELPDGAGPDLCLELRRNGVNVPILMLTARAVVSDRVRGLDCGADDYVCKPCVPEEILARLRALLRRQSDSPDEAFIFGDVVISERRQEVLISGNPVTLPRKQYQLLLLLAENSGMTISPDAIVSRLAARGIDLSRTVIKVYISQIQSKLKEAGALVDLSFADGGYCFRMKRD